MEFDVAELKRKLAESDNRLKENGKDIDMLRKLVEENQKQTAILLEVAPAINSLATYAEKTYDVVKPLNKASSIVIKIGAAFVLIWHGAKLIYSKIMLFS